MADLNEREAKLVQYLSEAYGKERELEASLGAHIAMTAKGPYAKRLKQHLKETKAHGKAVERRIKKLGGGGQLTQAAAGVVKAAAKGPLHALRGSGEQEKLLKNAKTEYFNEHEEIATYLAIEVFAEKLGDKETAKLAKGIRREEERMAKFLEGQIKSLTRAVVGELPRAPRSGSAKAKAKKAKPAAKRSSAKAKRATKKAAAKSSRKKSPAKSARKKAAAKPKAKARKAAKRG
jgi:ferritin-like metal-binding protein YciE